MDVLHGQFNHGHLSLEEIKTILGSDYGTVWPAIQKKFITDNKGLFFNERLEEEKEKRRAFTASRKNNLEGKNSHMGGHLVGYISSDMENININEIIDYLNKKASTKFRASSDKTKRAVNARVNEGYKLEDFKKVIDTKCAKWLKDPKMVDYLRPETLFGTKFESYLNEKRTPTAEPDPSEPKEFGGF